MGSPFAGQISAVTIDLWDTLLHDSPDGGSTRSALRIQGIQEVLRQVGEEFPQNQMGGALQRCRDICWALQREGQDLSFSEQVRTFLQEMDGDLLRRIDGATVDLVAHRYADAFWSHPPRLDPEVPSTLAALRQKGYKLGLISNTGATPGHLFRGYLERLGIDTHFQVLTFSDEMGIAKPAPKIFHLTLEQLKVPPSQAVHIGDQLWFDVLGAKRAGMGAIWRRGFDDSLPQVPPDLTIDRLGELTEVL